MANNKKPLHTIRLSGGLKATIWLNVTENGKTFANTEITRSYKTDDGWREGNSYRPDDLLKVARLATLAFDRIEAGKVEQNASSKGGA